MLRAGGRNCEGVEEVEGKKKDARLTTQGRSRKSSLCGNLRISICETLREIKNPQARTQNIRKAVCKNWFSAPLPGGLGGI